MVFTPTTGPVDLRHLSQGWAWTPGACWHRPWGPGSRTGPGADHPAVHLACEDAEAYAAWAGLSLPTEAEWEMAARGGVGGVAFVLGDDPEHPGEALANYRHSDLPWRADPGYGTSTPLGSFPTNGYGRFDMAGNVWEWTKDWYTSQHPEDPDEPCCVPRNPAPGTETASRDPAQRQFPVPRRVIKGGSFLCADSYCMRYRPAARRPQMRGLFLIALATASAWRTVIGPIVMSVLLIRVSGAALPERHMGKRDLGMRTTCAGRAASSRGHQNAPDLFSAEPMPRSSARRPLSASNWQPWSQRVGVAPASE